ncbi:LemA family protein [Terrisporobacter sp.]|uniref:LemA family protein n=1 Tax=Terrisporobacter sp. TaxID=1965305 RepID=UPI0028A0AA00|nr:LemA family protein [Terrisporobacter sp.]
MKVNKTVIITLSAVVMTIILCVFATQGFQNKAIGLEEQILTASSDIEVQEKRRVDLIYNLVDTVKEYDKHEAETLKNIVEARGSKGGDISDVTTVLSAVTEAYPDLKSNENYKQLMTELTVTENMMLDYRTNYNKQIKEYNRYVRKFPNRMILNLLGYETVSYTYLEYNSPSNATKDLFNE